MELIEGLVKCGIRTDGSIMQLSIEGKESFENVKMAFACESQSRNRYTYFAKQARLEGDEKTAELFDEMADNEREHAKVWYKVLNNGLGSIMENLEDASSKEHEEWEYMYPAFAQKAREEGLELLAIMFDNIAAIEKNHEQMFAERMEQLKNCGTKKGKAEDEMGYCCSNCGFVTTQQIEFCPVCEETGTFVLK